MNGAKDQYFIYILSLSCLVSGIYMNSIVRVTYLFQYNHDNENNYLEVPNK